MPHDMKGHVPFALYTPAASKEASNADPAVILKAVNEHIRAEIGAIACLDGVVRSRLPKTRSGKTLRVRDPFCCCRKLTLFL